MGTGALGKQYEDGETIIHESQIGDCMYVIQEGQVEIVKTHRGQEVRLAVLSEGEFFGEMAIFEHERRTATVRALGPAKILTVDQKNFIRRIHEDPSLAYQMVQTMSHRIRSMNDEVTHLRTRQPFRVAVVGVGRVGATCAYALLLRGIAAEIVLINAHPERAEGEAMDLNHSLLFAQPVKVWAGDFADCQDADIIILAAGVAQRPGENRLDLLKRNADATREIVARIMQHTSNAILIVVTNPVDVLTYVALKESRLPPSRVMGSGTILDTARFRYLLSQRFSVDPRSVHAFVIGEHGDSQVPVWSLANIAGITLDKLIYLNANELDAETKADITDSTRRAAYEIISRKGATYYAIAAGVLRIIEALVRSENSVLTLSSLVSGAYRLSDVCLSLPSVVNRHGIVQVLELPLEQEEQQALERSANIIREAINSTERSSLPVK